MANVFHLKTFCVITGASKGLGRSIAIQFANQFPFGSFMLLLARSKDGLEETKTLVQNNAPHINVCIHPIDLGAQDEFSFENLMQGIMVENAITPTDFLQAIIIHNAGSLGDVSKNLAEQNNSNMLKWYWDLNLTAVVLLNSTFLNLFKSNGMTQIVTINISSICALQPFKSWSIYCAGMYN